jgi:hypothetical protein
METFIVYIDDKQYALQQIVPMLPDMGAQSPPANWILIGCPPRLNRHSGRWITQAAQKKWRQDWTNEAVSEVTRLLEKSGNTVSSQVVQGSLVTLTQQIKRQVGAARVIDARRPKLAVTLDPVTAEQPQDKSSWLVPGGMAAIGAVIVMASD